MPQGANVVVQTQKIVVNPTTKSVAVINAGPQGPPGSPGPVGPPGPGTPNEYVKADGSISMTGALHTPELWLPGGATGPRLTSLEAAALASVKKAGDSMQGNLVLDSPAELSFGAAVRQMINLYGLTYAIGVQGSTWMARSGGDHSFYRGGVYSSAKNDPGAGGVEVARFQLQSSQNTIMIPGRGSNLLLGDSITSGPRVRIHLPASGEVAYFDFEGTTAGGGDFIFRSGTVSILTLENGVIRPGKPIYTNQTLRFPYGSHMYNTDGLNCYFGLYKDGTSPDAMGTRGGYMGFVNNEIVINNETGTNLKILSGTTGVVVLGVGTTEKVRIDTGGVINCGRTSNGAYYTDSGVDMRPTGQFLSTCDTSNSYPWLIRIGAALAAGQKFLTLRTAVSGAGTEIGSISMATTTSCAFNTTSHGPFKGNVEDLDDDEAIARIEKWRPVAFQWKLDEEGQLAEDGIPQGEVQHGFIAQEMNEINPSAVTPGYGTWEEHLVWREKQQAYSAALSEYMRVEAEIDVINTDNRAILEPWEEACREREASWRDDPKQSRSLPRKPATKKVPVLPELPEKPDELSPFSSWQADWTMLVPDLSAAVQALVRQNRALTERIDELERSSR
jgi:hypothetical protein